MTLVLKRGDTAPQFRAQCGDDRTPVDLTGCTAKLLMSSQSGSLVVNSALTVEAGTAGWVSRAWASNDLSVADTYRVEVEVTWPNGTVQTFPPDGYGQIRVVTDLG